MEYWPSVPLIQWNRSTERNLFNSCGLWTHLSFIEGHILLSKRKIVLGIRWRKLALIFINQIPISTLGSFNYSTWLYQCKRIQIIINSKPVIEPSHKMYKHVQAYKQVYTMMLIFQQGTPESSSFIDITMVQHTIGLQIGYRWF